MEYKELFKIADQVKENAYVPFSKFQVGAALLTKDGQVYTGVNAISEGKRQFSAIAIASSGGEALPCGICRQFMYEFCPELDVITGKDENSLRVQPLNVLLPEGFRLEKE